MAEVVMLKFFGGLTNQEVASTLGVAERTVERDWAFARSWLAKVVDSRGSFVETWLHPGYILARTSL